MSQRCFVSDLDDVVAADARRQAVGAGRRPNRSDAGRA